MKTINLPYGKGKLTIEIPEERLAGILLSKAHDYQAKMEEEELVKVYRSLSGEKRKQLGTYVKMLEEYSGRIDD